MEPPAFKGYVCLLLAAWQADDCTLPPNDDDLARFSRLGIKAWTKYKGEILRKFRTVTVTVGDTLTHRIINDVEFELWKEAKRIHEARRAAAKDTNSKRSPLRSADRSEERSPQRSPIRSQAHNNNNSPLQEQGTGGSVPPPITPTATVTVDDFDADPLENIPEGLALTQYAGFILEHLHIAAGYALRVKTGDTIGLLAGEEACSQPEATRRLLGRMRGAQTNGPVKWLFWLEDGNWKARAAFSIGIEDEA